MPRNRMNQDHVPPSLVVPKADAEKKIRIRMDKGRTIRDLPINSYDDFVKAEAQRQKWLEYNIDLLSRLFDKRTFAEEYDFGYDGSWSPDPTLELKVFEFRKNMDKCVTGLESVLERLELIPELEEIAPMSAVSEQIPCAVGTRLVAFVAMSFDDSDQEINEYVLGILKALRIHFETGQRYSEESIPQKVQNRIRRCDVFIAIFVRRDELRDGQFTTPAWLVKEAGMALEAGKGVIALVEEGIKDIGGLNLEKELILFDRNDIKKMHKATIKLLEALKEHGLI